MVRTPRPTAVTTDPLAALLEELDPARIAAVAPADEVEMARAARESLRSGALAVLRADSPRHLTVSCLLVAGPSHDPAIALGLHVKSGQWRQLGGHVDPGDASLRNAAVRELREESSIEVDAIATASSGAVGADSVRLSAGPLAVREFPVGTAQCEAHVDILFAARAPHRVALQTTDAGISRVDWFSPSALPQGTAADLRDDLPSLLRRLGALP